jgi:hypothetical protein
MINDVGNNINFNVLCSELGIANFNQDSIHKILINSDHIVSRIITNIIHPDRAMFVSKLKFLIDDIRRDHATILMDVNDDADSISAELSAGNPYHGDPIIKYSYNFRTAQFIEIIMREILPQFLYNTVIHGRNVSVFFHIDRVCHNNNDTNNDENNDIVISVCVSNRSDSPNDNYIDYAVRTGTSQNLPEIIELNDMKTNFRNGLLQPRYIQGLIMENYADNVSKLTNLKCVELRRVQVYCSLNQLVNYHFSQYVSDAFNHYIQSLRSDIDFSQFCNEFSTLGVLQATPTYQLCGSSSVDIIYLACIQ